jgi:hypothetical protein
MKNIKDKLDLMNSLAELNKTLFFNRPRNILLQLKLVSMQCESPPTQNLMAKDVLQQVSSRKTTCLVRNIRRAIVKLIVFTKCQRISVLVIRKDSKIVLKSEVKTF